MRSALYQFPNIQFYVVGPIGDVVGQYAATKLKALSTVPGIQSRLFFRGEFFRVSAEMRYGADFTICPSYTEPFGYVDVEFAWHGCPTIGSLVGGLGKVPGICAQTLGCPRPLTAAQPDAGSCVCATAMPPMATRTEGTRRARPLR